MAFSLLDDDEPLAQEFIRLLPGTVVPFLYSRRQLELVGEDGVEAFSSVFATDARTVTVLHRSGWGRTRWTAVEATAIRTRAWNEGPDFVTLVKLDDEPPPTWFPAIRVWADFRRLGPQGVAAVLAERIQARGRALREESAAELAVRVRAEQEAELRQRAFLQSDAGVVAANSEAGILFDEFVTLGTAIDAAPTRVRTDEAMLYPRRALRDAWMDSIVAQHAQGLGAVREGMARST